MPSSLSRHALTGLCTAILATTTVSHLSAGEPVAAAGKVTAMVEPNSPLYLGTISSGIKASDSYVDANVNLVVPVWSSLGRDGVLGGDAIFLAPYVSWGEGGEVASSLGLGWRHLFNDQPVSALTNPKPGQAGFWEEGVAIGANLYLDMLDTEAGNQFWQLGFGLEVGTRYVEWRGNYYLPLSDRQLAERKVVNDRVVQSRTRTRTVQDSGNPYDAGNGYYEQDVYTRTFATTTTTTTNIQRIFERYENGLEGWDMEVALLVPWLDQWLDVKLLGGYFSLENSPFGPQPGGTGNVEGWKAGVEVRPVPAVVVTGMWYEDERFLGSDWTVAVQLQLPFEGGDLGDGKGFWGRITDAFKPRRRHMVERMAEPVHRQNAAIKVGSEYEQENKVTSQTTQTNTRVISQAAGKIVLGPAPSGTDFQYYTSGSLQISKSGGGTETLTGGSLFLNSQNQALYVSTDGTITKYLGVITPPSGPNPSDWRNTPPVVTTQLTFAEPNNVLTVTGNTLVLNPSGGGTSAGVADVTGGFVKIGTGTLVLNSTIYGGFVPAPSFNGGITVQAGSLNLAGNSSYNGTLILNGGTLLGGTAGTFSGNTVLKLNEQSWSLLDWSKITTNELGQYIYNYGSGTVIIQQAPASP